MPLPATTDRRDVFFARAITLLLVIGKLVLVAQNEIAAIPYDAWSYVTVADSAYPWRFVGPSIGYPVWLWLTAETGLPQRIAIEGAFLGAAILLAYGIGWRISRLTGYLLVLAVTAFSPASYYFFDTAMSDGLFACITLAALGVAGALLTSRCAGWRHGGALVALGLLFGALQATRKESPLVFFAVGLLLVAFVVRELRDRSGWLRAVGRSVARVGLVLLALEAVVVAVLFSHYESEQVWTLSLSEMASHGGMLARLAAIDGEGPSIRYVPVTRRALRAAYAVSPTLQRFQPLVEAPDNPYLVESERWLGLPGEVGAGWVWHIFNAAGPKLGLNRADQLDATYRQIDRELDAAFADHRLRKRFVVHPLFGSHPSVWTSFLPASLHNVTRAVRTPTQPWADAGFEPELFDRVLLRRGTLTSERQGVVQGWAYTSTGVAVQTAASSTSAVDPVATTREARPELQKAYAREGVSVPLMSGFRANIPVSREGDYQLRFDVGGQTYRTAVPLEVGRVRSVALDTRGNRIVFAVDELPAGPQSVETSWRRSVMQFGLSVYPQRGFWLIVPFVVLAAIALLVRDVARRRQAALGPLLVLVTASGWILARIGLYVFVDAAAWGAEPRYVQLAGLMLTALFASSAAVLLQRAAQAARRFATARFARRMSADGRA